MQLKMTSKKRQKESERERGGGRLNGKEESSTSSQDGRSLQARVVYIGEYRLCISIMGNYRGGNRSWAARYNRTAPRPRHVRSLSLSRPARRLACSPCLLSCLSWMLSRADSRVSQLSWKLREPGVRLD